MAKCGVGLVEVTPAMKDELGNVGIPKSRLRGRVLLDFRHWYLGKYVTGSYLSQYYFITTREESAKVKRAAQNWERRTGRSIESLYK